MSHQAGERLVLSFYTGRALSGSAAVVCMADRGERVLDVMRVTRQDHDTDHAPTHYRRVTVNRGRLRSPTAAELGDDSWRRLWDALEAERQVREG